MSVRPIRLFPDDVLSRPGKPVLKFDHNLDHLIVDLWDTLGASPGVGLAAPQIGVSSRVSVIDIGRVFKQRKIKSTYSGPLVLINPTIEKFEGCQIPREGCLSVPDLLANVTRYEVVRVSFQDTEGTTRYLESTGFEALALQHEIDHLNGFLFLDRVANIKTDLFRRQSKI